MTRGEKRKHNRLTIGLELVCSKAGSGVERVHKGRTVDISTGGLFFEAFETEFEPGHLVNVELSIPPTQGLMELGGRLSTCAKVIRVTGKNRIAIQFCQSPHFWL